MTEGGRAGRTYASRPLPRIVSVCGMSFQLQAGKGRGWRHADLPSAPHFDLLPRPGPSSGALEGGLGGYPAQFAPLFAYIAWLSLLIRPRGRFRSTCASAKRPAVAAERSTVSNAPQLAMRLPKPQGRALELLCYAELGGGASALRASSDFVRFRQLRT